VKAKILWGRLIPFIQAVLNFFGCRFRGRTFDCGAKLGFLVANIAFGLERDDLAADLRAEIRALLER
jgi:UTP-glucose-1-phosphate uridylyltransferase